MTNSLLDPKQVLKDTLDSLPSVYLGLIIINLPVIISSFFSIYFSPIISSFIPFLYSSFSQFLAIIYLLFIFPYFQGVSILYTYKRLEDKRYKILSAYKTAGSKIFKLIKGNFIVFFRVFILFLMVFSLGAIFGIVLLAGSSNNAIILKILFPIFFIFVTYYLSELLLVPHFIIIEKLDVDESFTSSLSLIKNNRLRILLLLIIIAILTATLSYVITEIFSESASEVVIVLCQPLFTVFSVIVYKHLKKN